MRPVREEPIKPEDQEVVSAPREAHGVFGGQAFAEDPVPLSVFVQGTHYLNNPPLSSVQYDAVRHLEQVFYPETHTYLQGLGRDWRWWNASEQKWVETSDAEEWTPVRFINFAYLEWGKGSGKDHVCRVAIARVAYLLGCLKSPQAYYDMPEQDSIHMLNVAASATQAGRAFFAPLKQMIRSAPCFRDRFVIREAGAGGSIEFKTRSKFSGSIEAVSGHSETETQEGLNLLVGIADEISAFKTRDEIEKFARATGREPGKSAEAILKLMRTSARTRFPTLFKNVAISYPRFKGDAIQQLVQRGMDDHARHGHDSRVYVSGPLATWEVNPRVPGKEVFREDYEDDPIMAQAMYECRPDASVNRVFRNDAAVHAAFSARRARPITVEYHWGKDELGSEDLPGLPPERSGWQARFHFSPDLYPLHGAIYAIHADLALSGDRAGVAMAHVKNWMHGDWRGVAGASVTEFRPQVKVDFMLEFEADIGARPQPREIQIRWFRKLVWQLMTRGFVIGLASADKFESADTLQILESRGVETARLSSDRKPEVWNALRDVMYDHRLEAYWDPRVVDQILALTRLPNGKVDHPPGGAKDMADAVVGSVVGALQLGGTEGDNPMRADEVGKGSMTVGSPWNMPPGMDAGIGMGGGMAELGPPSWLK